MSELRGHCGGSVITGQRDDCGVVSLRGELTKRPHVPIPMTSPHPYAPPPLDFPLPFRPWITVKGFPARSPNFQNGSC
jgi:hypothetical protein